MLVTGSDGTYTITVRSAEDILVFSFVGYNTEEISVGGKSTIDVVMIPGITALETVVVMGYSSKKRNEITSAVTTVSSDKLKDVTANDIGTMLQGKVPGIQVSTVQDLRVHCPTSVSGVFLLSALPRARYMW